MKRSRLFSSTSLGLYFFRFQLLQSFCKLSQLIVLQQKLPLHFLQNVFDFQIELELFKGL